jgi:hypothetical protein
MGKCPPNFSEARWENFPQDNLNDKTRLHYNKEEVEKRILATLFAGNRSWFQSFRAKHSLILQKLRDILVMYKEACGSDTVDEIYIIHPLFNAFMEDMIKDLQKWNPATPDIMNINSRDLRAEYPEHKDAPGQVSSSS